MWMPFMCFNCWNSFSNEDRTFLSARTWDQLTAVLSLWRFSPCRVPCCWLIGVSTIPDTSFCLYFTNSRVKNLGPWTLTTTGLEPNHFQIQKCFTCRCLPWRQSQWNRFLRVQAFKSNSPSLYRSSSAVRILWAAVPKHWDPRQVRKTSRKGKKSWKTWGWF